MLFTCRNVIMCHPKMGDHIEVKIKSRFIFNGIESVTTWEGADMWKRHCKHDLKE